MLRRALPLFAAIALSALAACNRATPTADMTLQRDLDLARNQAPQASANMNIAPDEVIPAGNRSRAVLPRAERVRRPVATAPTAASAATSAVSAAASAPPSTHDSAVAAAPATQRPSAQGAISAPPPGGYKTMGEIIRKAPFPINP